MLMLLVFMLSAVIFDLQTYRIPNRLILLSFLTGELLLSIRAFSAFYHQGIWTSLLLIPGRTMLMLGMVCIMFPFWRLKGIGGGDVKLLGISVLYIGFCRSLNAFVYACVYCLALSGIRWLGHRLFPRKIPELKKKNDLHIIHFSLPLLLGVISELLWGGILKAAF